MSEVSTDPQVAVLPEAPKSAAWKHKPATSHTGGMNSMHFNPVTGWLVRPDGTVVYRTEQWS